MFARMPKGKSCRTQSNIEFLKSPYFRVYVISSNKKELIRLAQMLDEHKSVYTVVLGLSECIANFKFIGMFEGKFFNKNNNFINIASVIPLCCIRSTGDINFLEEGKKFLKIHMPTEFNQKRELTNSKNFVFEAEGKTISVKVKEYVTLEELGENVIFF
jgi:CRISPR-associated protein Cas5h